VWYEYVKLSVRAIEIDHLRSACGVQRIDRVRNIIMLEICGMQKPID